MNLRSLAAALVVANLALAGWWMFRSEPTDTVPGRAAPVPLDAPRLALIGELDVDARKALEKPRPEGAPAVPPEAPSVQAPTAGLLCVSVGPIDDQAVAGPLADKLRSTGIVVEIREESGQLRSGYWVHLPPFPSREAAEKVASDLRQRGAGELFIVTASEQRHAISLGLFSTPERADQRAAEVGELGFRPRIAERFREGAVFWLEYREPAEMAFDLTPLLEGLDPAIQRNARSCPTAP
jgi:hypothetical protein